MCNYTFPKKHQLNNHTIMNKAFTLFAALLVSIPAWAQEISKREITVNGVTFNMVAVEGGRFNMGGTCEQLTPEDDEFPIHVVTLDDFYIGETEVTQALWSAVMGENPSGFQGDPNLPVERVMWIECQTFVSKLSTLTGINFRLPTESEWEYAARGGKYTHYYQYSGSDDIDEVAWHDGNCTHVVGQLQPNELGIYDMSGNVFEWCQDWFGDYDMMPIVNPTGPEDGENRVRRGGSWGGTYNGSRVSFRRYELENIRYNYIGLRLAASEMGNAITGIPSVTTEQQPKSDTRYNVIGQPVGNDYHGIVIEDGKKSIIK
ncbi:MAG: SUMF1/EgtB/PvdO family nonheme iron enzyme [Muribaculaceae bacterium]|nr:SUMF1/EgtB/PvdO family nonheme iron enzyme [Muribaculaceae bacterium]